MLMMYTFVGLDENIDINGQYTIPPNSTVYAIDRHTGNVYTLTTNQTAWTVDVAGRSWFEDEDANFAMVCVVLQTDQYSYGEQFEKPYLGPTTISGMAAYPVTVGLNYWDRGNVPTVLLGGGTGSNGADFPCGSSVYFIEQQVPLVVLYDSSQNSIFPSIYYTFGGSLPIYAKATRHYYVGGGWIIEYYYFVWVDDYLVKNPGNYTTMFSGRIGTYQPGATPVERDEYWDSSLTCFPFTGILSPDILTSSNYGIVCMDERGRVTYTSLYYRLARVESYQTVTLTTTVSTITVVPLTAEYVDFYQTKSFVIVDNAEEYQDFLVWEGPSPVSVKTTDYVNFEIMSFSSGGNVAASVMKGFV